MVDYGGLFHGDVRPGHAFAEGDHRVYRPAGWVEVGNEKMERMRAERERLRQEGAALMLQGAWRCKQARRRVGALKAADVLDVAKVDQLAAPARLLSFLFSTACHARTRPLPLPLI